MTRFIVTAEQAWPARDRTVDAVEALYDNSVPGYGELFRMLSYHDIGPASMLSRASAGRVGKKTYLYNARVRCGRSTRHGEVNRSRIASFDLSCGQVIPQPFE